MVVLKETTAHRRQLKTRIMEAAIAAFKEKGIKAVKMDDIATGLSISKRTVYEIFEDKEHLLYESMQHYNEQQRQQLVDYAAQNNSVIAIILEAYRLKVGEMRTVNPAFYTDIIKYPRLAAYIKDNKVRTREEFVKFMQRGVEEGYLTPDVNYRMIPHMFDALGEYIMRSELLGEYSLDELFTNYILTIIRGLCTETGLKAVDNSIKFE